MLFAWWWACGMMTADRGLEAPLGSLSVAGPGQISQETGHLTVLATGDIMIHRAVERAAASMASTRQTSERHGYEALFEGIRTLVRDVDVAFANLETPVAPSRFRARRPRVFNADPLVVESLVATGFDLVSLANNHAFDQGPEGLEETMTVLDDRSLGFVGVGSTCEEARTPVVMRRSGLTVAFFAATELLNEDWNVRADATCTATLDPSDLIQRAQAAREAGADFVVLSLHWGDEYVQDPGASRRRLARRLVEGGVDVILGHHAHVLQPVELHRTSDGRAALVAYGLGNLISNQAAWYLPGVHAPRSARPRDGLALSFRLSRRQIGEGETATWRSEIVDIRTIPLWTVNDRLRAGTEIRVVPTDDAVDELLGSEEDGLAWVTELRARAQLVRDEARPTIVAPRH
ncbi:MAG: CapA family protein [Myxococcota bacterium]